MMRSLDRRTFLQQAAAACGSLAGGSAAWLPTGAAGQEAAQPPGTAPPRVALPRLRVPLSFIIDDSTCLVNMGRFCMPQFAAAWPDRSDYQRPWRSWPTEIPDAFVREFGQWSAQHGVKGKYSIVPYPACVGWLDRELPGWSQRDLRDSLQLVRELMVPSWDIHPEMITHTRVIDLATGRPSPTIEAATMENWYPQQKISVDELAAYLAYALRILKNCELPCEGITTPGGFGNLVKSELPLAVQQAVQDVYKAEIPHYFKYVVDGDENAEPLIENLRADAPASHDLPPLTVNVRAGTGDWFGGWDGAERCRAELYISADGQSGRMVDLIRRRQPAIMLCHWPGMYTNGTQQGFLDFQRVVLTLHEHFGDQIVWMKLSEIARYWTAKHLARLAAAGRSLNVASPVVCPDFTVECPGWDADQPLYLVQRESDRQQITPLDQVGSLRELRSGSWVAQSSSVSVCWDLPAGTCQIHRGRPE
jgi:hypothetical protein